MRRRRALVVAAAVLAVGFLIVAPASAAAQTDPPCIPSPSIPPTFGTQCGQIPRPEPTPDLQAPDSVDEITLPVEAPVAPDWGVAGYSVAHFAVPVRPGVGTVRIGSFIAARELPRLDLIGYGNDRTFNQNFDARRTKLTLELNFTTGEGTAWADPSCARYTGTSPQGVPTDNTYCHEALPLDGSDSGSQLLVGSIQNADRTTSFEAKYSAKQSFTEGVPGVRSFYPKISGDLTVTTGEDGSVCLSGKVDQFPSVEAYLYRPAGGEVEQLYRSKESAWGPEIGLSEFVDQKTVRACTDPA